MASFKLTRKAQRDLVSIGRYGQAHFGDARAEQYLDALEDCCGTLGERPNPGQRCAGFRAVWRVPCGSHVIFYRLLKTGVRVSRILHKNRLPALHL